MNYTYGDWWLVSSRNGTRSIKTEPGSDDTVVEYLGRGWGGTDDVGEWSIIDRVCTYGHWFAEHSPDCESPGCDCTHFKDDPEANTSEALARRQ